MKFMHLPKAKQFTIGTRFYDPQKEAMKEREERIKRELEMESSEQAGSYYGANIKGKFRNASGNFHSKTISEARRKSNMRLLYIVIILSVLFYLLLK